MIVEVVGADIRLVSVSMLFLLPQIKGRAEKAGSAGSLKNTVPVSALCMGEGRKNIFCVFSCKKFGIFIWEIYVNLKSCENGIFQNAGYIFMKFFCLEDPAAVLKGMSIPSSKSVR